MENDNWIITCGFSRFDEEKSVKYSNALCLLNLHQCHELKMTVDYVLYRPTYDFFTQDIEKARKNRQVMKISLRVTTTRMIQAKRYICVLISQDIC